VPKYGAFGGRLTDRGARMESVTWPMVVAGLALGWCAGWASATAAHALLADPSPSGPPPPPRPAGWPRLGRYLAPDAAVQAALAVVGGLVPLLVPGPWWRWLLAGLLAVPLVQVAVTDLRERYVYTVVALGGLALGVACAPAVHDAAWWWGAAGAAVGFAVFGALYGLGRLLYRGGEPMASGDVTIAALVGAVAGPYVLSALVLGVLASGLAALAVLAARRSRHALLPYGPGLCLGGLLTLFFR
jgi:Type IV leader peptidase family